MDNVSKSIITILCVAALCYGMGFRAGKRAESTIRDLEAAQVAAQVETVVRRSSDALYDLSDTLRDQNLATNATKESIIENLGPDTCTVDAERVLQLDRIR